MSQRWIEVDPAELADVTTKKRDGITVTITASPHDLPDAFRGFFDDNLNRFVIEFKYIGEEKVITEESHGEYVTLRIGKNSGRIYGIEIDVHAAKAEWVALIQKALTERSRVTGKPRRLANYEAARRLIRERVPELAAAS